jgi:hypothetical protein
MGWARMAAVVCALIAIAIPAPAAGKVPRSFYGVVTQSRLDRADFGRMSRGRVGTLRTTLAWSQIDRSAVPGSYDWSGFDATVGQAARRRIAIFPTAYAVPDWVSLLEGCTDGCATAPPHTELGLSAWRSFLRAAVRRYGPGGAFWSQHPDLPNTPIRRWQIWNEQNDPGYFTRPDVDAYAALLRAASEAIHGLDPDAEVILGGMYGYAAPAKGGIPAADYLRELYGHPGIEAAFDGVAIHPYAGDLEGVKAQVRRAHRIVRAAGDRQASIWISEIGWASGGIPSALNRGRQGQARRLSQAFRYFTRVRTRLGIRAVLWYAWRDVAGPPGYCFWCPSAGLFPVRSLDQPKPAWTSFLSFTGGR